jgi:hypothetical protein
MTNNGKNRRRSFVRKGKKGVREEGESRKALAMMKEWLREEGVKVARKKEQVTSLRCCQDNHLLGTRGLTSTGVGITTTHA